MTTGNERQAELEQRAREQDEYSHKVALAVLAIFAGVLLFGPMIADALRAL